LSVQDVAVEWEEALGMGLVVRADGDGDGSVDGGGDGSAEAPVVANSVGVVVMFGTGSSAEEGSLLWVLELVGRGLAEQSKTVGREKES
jgi:hypothetical protein